MSSTGDATEALRRGQFAHRVSAQLDDLRGDPDAWRASLDEAEPTSVRDGIA